MVEYITGCTKCDETVRSEAQITDVELFDELLDNFGRLDDEAQGPQHVHTLIHDRVGE